MPSMSINLTRPQFDYLLRRIINNEPMPCQFDLWIKKNVDDEDEDKTVNIFELKGTKSELTAMCELIADVC